MSLFGSIVDKIVHYAASALPGGTQPTAGADATTGATGATAAAAPVEAATTTPDADPEASPASAADALQSVDVGAVLTALSEKRGGGLDWQTSIVDLLKLLDLDSSLSARKGLAQELDVHAGEDGSAGQNIALHKAVVAKLAENGGKIPASMQG